MSQPAHHLENGSASASENGVDRLAAADAAKAEANAHFKGACIVLSGCLPCDHKVRDIQTLRAMHCAQYDDQNTFMSRRSSIHGSG